MDSECPKGEHEPSELAKTIVALVQSADRLVQQANEVKKRLDDVMAKMEKKNVEQP